MKGHVCLKMRHYVLLLVFIFVCVTGCSYKDNSLKASTYSSDASKTIEGQHSMAEGTDEAMSALTDEDTEDRTFLIVTTTFPVYDWVRNILGDGRDDVDLILLNDRGEDYHSFQPDEKDRQLIKESNLFFGIGGISEEWAYAFEEQLMTEAENKPTDESNATTASESVTDQATVTDCTTGPVMVYLLDELRDHAIKLPMNPEISGQDSELYDDGIEFYDEHIWLSPSDAIDIVSEISDYLTEYDEEHADEYAKNTAIYTEALIELDAAYQEAADTASCTKLIVADRYPFRYLTESYLLTAYPLFGSCPSETSTPNPETVSEIVQMMKADGTMKVVVDSDVSSDAYLAITDELTDRAIELIPIRSMHAVSMAEAEEEVTYISVMQENLQNLCRILEF